MGAGGLHDAGGFQGAGRGSDFFDRFRYTRIAMKISAMKTKIAINFPWMVGADVWLTQ